MLLHEEHVRVRAVHRDVVNAVADFGSGFGNVLGIESLIDWPPGLAAVVGAECACGRDGDVDPLGITRIQNDGMKAHPTGAWLPTRAGAVAAQPGKFLPVLPAIGRAEQGGVFHSGINRVRIAERRLDMPDALELPRMLRAVIPLMSGKRFPGWCGGVVYELVALGFRRSRRLSGLFARRCSRLYPSLAAVIGALNNLPKPATGLGRIQPIRVHGRALEVIDFPARKMRAADVPLLALSVRCQDESALACANDSAAAKCSIVRFTI